MNLHTSPPQFVLIPCDIHLRTSQILSILNESKFSTSLTLSPLLILIFQLLVGLLSSFSTSLPLLHTVVINSFFTLYEYFCQNLFSLVHKAGIIPNHRIDYQIYTALIVHRLVSICCFIFHFMSHIKQVSSTCLTFAW